MRDIGHFKGPNLFPYINLWDIPTGEEVHSARPGTGWEHARGLWARVNVNDISVNASKALASIEAGMRI
jgi:hypothetical protein